MSWNISKIIESCGFPSINLYYSSRRGVLVAIDDIDKLTDELNEWCKQNERVFELLEYYGQGGWNLNYCSPNDLQVILNAEWLDDGCPEKVDARRFIETDGYLDDMCRDDQKQEKMKEPRPGVVYVLKSDNGLYKIGRAKDFEPRLLQLQIHLPYDLKLVMLIGTEDCIEMEGELHKLFADKRKKGEWFKLDSENLKHIKEYALGEV